MSFLKIPNAGHMGEQKRGPDVAILRKFFAFPFSLNIRPAQPPSAVPMDLPSTSLAMVSQFMKGGLTGLTQSRGISGKEEDITCDVCVAPKTNPYQVRKTDTTIGEG